MAETVLLDNIFLKTSDSYFRHENSSGQSVLTINGDYVRSHLSADAKTRDLKKYIL